jgi:hypothetical protein
MSAKGGFLNEKKPEDLSFLLFIYIQKQTLATIHGCSSCSCQFNIPS